MIQLAGVLPRTTLRESPLIRDKPPLYYNFSSLGFNACYLYHSVSVPALCCARRRHRLCEKQLYQDLVLIHP